MKRLIQIFMNRQACQLAASLAVVLVLAAGGWHLASRWLAGRFAQLAVEGQDEPAPVYEMLLALDDASVGALVKNASLRDPAIAKASRKALFTRVDAWNAATAANDQGELAERLNKLLKQVKRQVPQFTTSGQAWANRFTRHVLSHSSKLPEQDRIKVIQIADSLLDELSVTPAKEDLMPAQVDVPLIGDENFPAEPELIVQAEIEENAVPIAESTPEPIDATPQVKQNPPVAVQPIKEEASPKNLVSKQPSWKPDWQTKPPKTIIDPDADATVVDPVAKQSDRQLLTYIHEKADEIIAASNQRKAETKPTASGPAGTNQHDDDLIPIDAYLIEVQEELVKRGYTSLHREEVRLFVSEKETDRMQLVILLQAGSSGYHARMMLQLAQDTSPKVRIAAITTLGTSSRPELVEAAWKLSLRDTDPQVAALADQLRQRLR